MILRRGFWPSLRTRLSGAVKPGADVPENPTLHNWDVKHFLSHEKKPNRESCHYSSLRVCSNAGEKPTEPQQKRLQELESEVMRLVVRRAAPHAPRPKLPNSNQRSNPSRPPPRCPARMPTLIQT